MAAKALCQIVTPVGNLGYGFEEGQVEDYLKHNVSSFPGPTALIMDSGSTDSGPNKLALGSMTCPRSAYERDLRMLVRLVVRHHVPLIISSAGGDGSSRHVDELTDIVEKVMREPEFSGSRRLKVMSVCAEIPHELVRERLATAQIEGCGPTVPRLTPDDIQQTPTIVAQMGPEPFFDAMVAEQDFDIIIGGRAYDPSPYVAYCAWQFCKDKNIDFAALDNDTIGTFTHMGKLMECGGQCCVPKSYGAVARIYSDNSFDIGPTDPSAMATPSSVVAHTLYEKTRPDILQGPGGAMDVSKAMYHQHDDGRMVSVRGSTFQSLRSEGKLYTLKLEGARIVGYRTLFMGTFRDPVLVVQVQSLLQNIEAKARHDYADLSEAWDVGWHTYGNESTAEPSKEVHIVCEVLADTQATATLLASKLRVWCVHAPYPGQKATAGNFAFGIGGMMEIEAGPCCEFSIYHLMQLYQGEERVCLLLSKTEDQEGTKKQLFTWRVHHFGKAEPAAVSKHNPSPIGTGILQYSSKEQASATNVTVPVLDARTSGMQTTSALPKKTLSDISRVLRSKNAGPFEITLDVIFTDANTFKAVRDSNLLDTSTICQLYNIEASDVIWCDFFEPALAFKATIARRRSLGPGKASRLCAAGGFMEDDIHASTRHVPLARLMLPEGLVRQLTGGL